MAYSSPRLQASRAFLRFVQRSLGNIYGYLHSYVFFPNVFRAGESKRKGTDKRKKGKTKPGLQGKNKKPAGKFGRKSGKKKTKI